ncbi:MAG TPA: ABC transporter permease [Mesotoga infera]|jgi:peptide/nickel transport system permease protein|nr:ABC transporter permease [Mesotoga sp.]NLI05586.1 ABC transporter permease [Thermotogaceae bacterium]HNS67705.1 ABC transporter permease [Mesotoga infera]HON27260.1 ABC transporter permease [Mesotoga infera]HPD37656.1 ABC transporter permease [Mesotoga infera]
MIVENQISLSKRENKSLKYARSYFSSVKGTIGFSLLLIFVFMAIFAPLIAPYSPDEMTDDVLKPPSAKHLFGTDHLGRDIYSRVVFGSRISLSVGFVAAGLSAVIGVLIGSFSGFYGGITDDIVSKIVDTFLMIPSFFLILIIVSIFGSNILYIMFVIGLTTWPGNARLMRAQALSIRERTFIMVARSTGESRIRILFGHVIPNGVFPVIANSALQMGGAILTEASLSFLGLGDPNLTSWGKLIFQGRPYMTFAPWMIIIPGIFVVLAVLAFSFIGDGLQFTFNPKNRKGE